MHIIPSSGFAIKGEPNTFTALNTFTSGLTVTAGNTSLVTLTTSSTAQVGGALTVLSGGANITGPVVTSSTLQTGGALTVLSGGANITGPVVMSSTLQTGGGLTVLGGGASIVGNSSITGNLGVSAVVTAGAGLIVSAGGATIAGGINVTSGGGSITGGLTIATGNLGVSAGNVTASGTGTFGTGLVVSSGGALVAGGITATSGNIATSAGNITAAGNMSASGTVTAGTGVVATTGSIFAQSGTVVANQGLVAQAGGVNATGSSIFIGPIHTTGNATIDGVIIAGSGSHQITTSAGLMDNTFITPGSNTQVLTTVAGVPQWVAPLIGTGPSGGGGVTDFIIKYKTSTEVRTTVGFTADSDLTYSLSSGTWIIEGTLFVQTVGNAKLVFGLSWSGSQNIGLAAMTGEIGALSSGTAGMHNVQVFPDNSPIQNFAFAPTQTFNGIGNIRVYGFLPATSSGTITLSWEAGGTSGARQLALYAGSYLKYYKLN